MKIYDVTLRDGNHALRHALDPEFVRNYCILADRTDSWAIEVGHGNGLGASSYLVGKSAHSDKSLLETARENLKNKLLAVHAIPGFATIKNDLKPAINIGVDLFRIATHVTEASIAEKHIEFLSSQNKMVHGVLMMSHMTNMENLIKQARLMLLYGASAVILMDSAGFFIPSDVSSRVKAIYEELGIEIGFHAHNNLGMGISNALTAFDQGATIIDGASMGLGAGAGNAQLELIVANMSRKNNSPEKIESYLELGSFVENNKMQWLPRNSSSSVESGLNGVFSGYAPQVNALADETGLPKSLIWKEMAKRKLVAGQETLIREIANDLMNL